MVSKDMLSRIVCHDCSKRFKDKDKIVSIISSSYNMEKVNFEPAVHQQADGLELLRIISFHTECFRIIANENYIP